METQAIRRKFLQYFKKNQHALIASSPVVPHDDPTLLFTNAGMNQFKDVFLGKSTRDYHRAATSQKCIRVGGKHNDLDNVGHTRRHLTFFEMLGNFSFGDYFKGEAIRFAWEVSTQIFEFEPDRIWPTVFREDDEAFEIWTHYVPASRITRLDEKDNFWEMGDTGPCGPCSELYYDRGPDYGAAEKLIDDPENERYLEFWNLVFMQYNRMPDGAIVSLPKPSIDTGAGLERIMSLKMNVDSVFETDILRDLTAQVENISGIRYDFHDTKLGPAFRVIADHLRCLAFAIADGAQPSNVDRGYVLRKVLRRAVRYGRMLGLEEPFLAKILPRLVSSMGDDYPELAKSQQRTAEILTSEEEAFIRTLRRGGNLLNQVIDHAKSHGNIISGSEAFKLKDTYGMPFEEIQLLAKDGGLMIDTAKFQELELEAKERSRSTQKVVQQVAGENLFASYARAHPPCQFLGYAQHSAEGTVTALVVNGAFVDEMQEGQEGMVILDQTPFYAEMGGQIGDIGVLSSEQQIFKVSNCLSPYKGIIAHVGKLEKGVVKTGMALLASIDRERRQKIANNHTATHLLHWALHLVLGEHVKQAGSVVDPHRLRFDFNHHKALTPGEIEQIENLVNNKIRENQPVCWYEISYEEAVQRPEIKQFFGEKYGSQVRVIDIDYSKELCGGTHTTATGTIGYFRIVKESSIAAGIRRIEAVTGAEAEAYSRESELQLEQCAALLKTQPTKLLERIEKLLEENKQHQQDLKQAKKGQQENLIKELMGKIETNGPFPLLLAEIPLPAEELKICVEEIMARNPTLALVAGSGLQDKCSLLVRVSDDLVKRGINAVEIVKAIAPLIEGSGGGKPQSAQAGGKAPQHLGKALDKAREYLSKR
jgi:alanyl-tRNA synthetase